MSHDPLNGTDRRGFLRAGALASAAVAGMAKGVGGQEPAKPPVVPRRVLGKTGVEITMLDQGMVRDASLDIILRRSYAAGVRVFDTAKVYRSEPNLKKWFEQAPEVRKEIFLVTKDEFRNILKPESGSPAKQMLANVDERLAALGTDQIDLFFIHGLGDHHPADEAIGLMKSKELKEGIDAIKKTGKVKFFGISCHHRERAAILQAAADANFLDAIMLQYSPWLEKESPLNKALDACHKAGIGLISMKQTAGQFGGPGGRGRTAPGGTPSVLEQVVQKVPMLKEKGLSPFQGLLTAIWTDERIASVCTSMRNTDQIRENCDAARKFEPLKEAELRQFRDAVLAAGPTLCADCDGRCSVAAGTRAQLGDLARFVTYHEHLGDRVKARHDYASLSPEARDWSGADLDAARAACPSKLDFARILAEADRHLA